MNESCININDQIMNNSLEFYKNLRTNLIYMGNVKVIGLASSGANEGKTVTAFQLALSFAQLNEKIVFIDCDLRRSSLKDYLLVGSVKNGLSEYLSNQCDDIIHKTNVENLDIIFTGKFPPNPSELLFGDKFSNLIKELRKQYDYVIVDTPPVMAGSDAIIVGRNCDGLVMVVRNQVTKRKSLLRAKQELERNGVKLLGSVLNGVKESDLDEYYYYRYYRSEK